MDRSSEISLPKFLRDVLGIVPVQTVPESGGKDNITCRISLSSGERIVVQAMRGIRNLHHAEFIGHVLDHIEASGEPIRVAPRWGEQRFYDYDGIWYQVMRELPGRILVEDDGINHIVDHARTLAYFHRATDDFDTKPYTEVNYHRQLSTFRRMAGDYAGSASDKEILDLHHGLEKKYALVSGESHALPRGVIWGDPVFKNILVDEHGAIVGAIDYDMVSVTTRLWDLADFARGYLKIPTFDRNAIETALDAYESIHPLSIGEREAYQSYLMMMILDTGYRYFLALFEGSGYYAELGGQKEKCLRCINEVDRVIGFYS